MEFQQVLTSESEIIENKEREQEYDGKIKNEWEDARRKFFTHQIQTKLNQAKATDKEQSEILSVFLEKQHKFALNQLGAQFVKYKTKIQQLQQFMREIEDQYQRKQRECLPMQQIIKNNFDTLTDIRIQYQLKYKWRNQCRYSITAFELFRVVHRNKLLTQVTLKGVEVQQFPNFINLLNQIIHNKTHQRNEMSWIKSFSPQKSLKLSINTKVKFFIRNKDDTLSQIKNLVFFRSLFCQLSDIIAEVRLGQWKQINQWNVILQKLWECLRRINKINIELWGGFVQAILVRAARSVLFGGLASFTEITQLSFIGIRFDSQVGINDFLTMEQSLRTLFNNNAVIHLKLEQCRNFPVFPAITTLQSTQLQKVSFRREYRFMREVTQTNPSLKSIKYSSLNSSNDEWRVDEQLFNQLQTLFIYDCRHISLDDISSQSPSNIKHLIILDLNFGKVDCLSVIFPKLAKLTYLQIGGINIGHQILCAIPSPYLEELIIQNSGAMIDLRVIDQKWPNLSILALGSLQFNQVENACGVFKFEGLKELRIKQGAQRRGNKAIIQNLKIRGIKVNYPNW